MKKLSVIFAAVMVAMLSITSCSKDETSARTDFTPEQHKQEIVKAVTNAANNIKGADNGDLLRVINHLYVLMSAPDQPVPTPQPEPPVVNSIRHMLATTKALCETNNPYVLSQYAQIPVYGAEDLSYIFTYNEETKTFDRTKGTNVLECRYTFEGKPVVFNLTASEDVNACEIHATIPEEGEMAIGLNVPKKLTGSVTWGDKKLFSLDADLKLNEDITVGTINIRTDANGYKFALSLDATPTNADLKANFTIKKQEILNVKMNITGNGFTETQKIVNAIIAGQNNAMKDNLTKMSYTDYCVMQEIIKLFSTVNAEITLMDDVVLKAHVDDVLALTQPLFEEANSEEEAAEHAKRFIDAFNTKAGIEFYYTDGTNKIAHLEIEANMEKQQLNFFIVFEADGNRVPAKNMFDEAFLSELKGAVAGKLMELVSFMPDLIEGIMPA